VVSRVDGEGAAASLGVEPNDVVVSMRAGVPGENADEPEIPIDSYDQLMGLFPAMGRPVSITFLKPREGGPSTLGVVNFTMDDELLKATKIVTKLTAESTSNLDAAVPQRILQQARGLAFIRVAKLGFGLSVKVGTGIVVARLGEALDSWSAPCAIGTAGMGMGLQWGAELTDFMLVLNTPEAVEAFSSGNQVSLGGNIGIAVGPVGRNAGATANIHGGELTHKGEEKASVKAAPVFAYSHSKGLFIGISLEGAVIKPRNDVNEKFYEGPVTPREILSGRTLPPASAEPLYDVLSHGFGEMEEAGAVVKRGEYSGGGGVGGGGPVAGHHEATSVVGDGPAAVVEGVIPPIVAQIAAGDMDDTRNSKAEM
jgi:lipid-binding SYLF domain-containing protein